MVQNTAQRPRFWRASLVYFLGNLLSKLALFFMLPVYTAHIPTADMGVFDTAVAATVFVSSFLFLDVGIGVMRFYLARRAQDTGDAILLAGLVLLAVSLAVYFPVAFAIARLTAVPHAELVVRYGIAYAFFTASGYFARAKGKTLIYAVTGVGVTLLQIALNLIFLLGGRFGYEALYISYDISAMLGALVLFGSSGVLMTVRKFPPIGKELKALFRFCLPLGLGAAAFLLLSSCNRVLVTLLVGASAGGEFAVAMKFAQIAFLVGSAFRFAWQEYSFAKGYGEAGQRTDKAYYTHKLKLLCCVLLLAALALIPAVYLGLWIFPNFIAPAYDGARALIPPILVGALLSVLADFLEPLFGTLQRTGLLTLSTLLGAAFNVALTLVLIYFGCGAFGAALGYLGGFAVVVALRLLFLRRLMSPQNSPTMSI